jgi:hypothetical protein
MVRQAHHDSDTMGVLTGNEAESGVIVAVNSDLKVQNKPFKGGGF